jgi:myo-inositol-1(or 4)-monophosphatase
MAEPGSPAERTELLELAANLARRAGALVQEARSHSGPDGAALDVATKATPTDLVTEADRRAERFLASELHTRRPADAVLGEEGAERAGRTGVRWLLDPIDGTVNYLYGVPHYAVSIAAERDGETVLGCVHDPVSGETFSAGRGLGAWLDGRRLTATGPATTLDQAVLGTGFSYDAGVRAAQGRVLAGVLPRVANVRRLGAASLDLCYVAAGRLDGYFEQCLAPWDMAAGGLVVEEAGAVLTGLYGRPPGRQIVVAATPAVAAELVELLTELRADEVV